MDITFNFHFSWEEIIGGLVALAALVAWVVRSGAGAGDGGGGKQ
jgi:hypothetical protein